MAKKIAQVRFTQQQLEQLEELNRQTDLNRPELVRRSVDYCILQIRELGYKLTVIPLPTIGAREAR